jgi:peptidoglycan-associated lipoprotein
LVYLLPEATFLSLSTLISMRSFIFATLFLLSASAAFAQPASRVTPAAMLAVADEQYGKTDYFRAAEWYEKYYEETKDRTVLYKTAMAYLSERDYVKAEKFFARVVADKKVDLNALTDLSYNYGRVLKMNSKYDEAIAIFTTYLGSGNTAEPFKSLCQAELEGAQLAKTMAAIKGIEIANAKLFNTPNGEYSPAIAPNGDVYYTAYRQEEIIVVDKAEGDYYSQVMVAKKNKTGFDEVKAAEADINRQDFHHGNVSLSPDGKEMYFTRVVLNGNSIGESKVYRSKKQGNGWSPAKEVEGGINGAFITKQPAIGELYGKSVMFFVSNMEGTKGGFDLFYATRNGDKFENPTNMGAVINTTGNEETPYYRDGKLFFSSNGHAGIGGMDLFTTTWDGASWSKPKNMGLPTNSPADDQYYTLDGEGYNGYLVSNREGIKSLKSKTCCDDLWSVALEKPVIGLKSLVLEAGKALAGTNQQLIDMTGGKTGATQNKNNEKGNNYDYPIDFEHSYIIITTKEGYFPDTTQFTTVGMAMSSSNVEKSITMRPIPPPPPIEVIDETIITTEDAIVLDRLLYDLAKWDILPDAAQELDSVYALMNTYSDMVIELSSHTDARGSDEANQTLSQKRAESAKAYLLNKGISPERIQAVGFGETRIINECVNGVTCPDDVHRQNRRTELRIVSGPTTIKTTRKEFKKRIITAEERAKQTPAPTPAPGAPKPGSGAPKPAPKPSPKPATKPGSGGRGSADTIFPEEMAAPAPTAKPAQVKATKKVSKAEIVFSETKVDFGTIAMGETPTHEYIFTNTGDEPILIEIITGCDCTDLSWTETEVAPGATGYVRATYKSERTEANDFNKPLDKDITIILANTYPDSGYPMVYELKFTVQVKK